MGRKRKIREETRRIDECECPYCGHYFNGRDACNADMDVNYTHCPKCEKQINVFISVEYICSPVEENEE